MQSQPVPSKNMKPFMIIWSGQAISLFGSAIVQFALIWWLTQETGSATVLATASLVGLVPPVLLGPFAGVLVDRWSRRLMLLLADGLVAVATIVLAYLYWIDVIAVWHVFVLLFVRAVGGAFHYPAFHASTSLMVPQEQLTRIQGINQIVEGSMIAMVNGPVRAIMQSVIAPDMQGRVMSLLVSLSSAMSPIGLMIAGPAADLLGIRFWYVFAGVVTALVGLAGFFMPPLLHLEDGRFPNLAFSEQERVGETAVTDSIPA